MSKILSAVLAAVTLILSGCTSIGPGTVSRDRFDYTTAISESWKNQMLLNMVKLRYGDTPVFLDVASVINSYELSGSAERGSQLDISAHSRIRGKCRSIRVLCRPADDHLQPFDGRKVFKKHVDPHPPLVNFFLHPGRL